MSTSTTEGQKSKKKMKDSNNKQQNISFKDVLIKFVIGAIIGAAVAYLIQEYL